jgi:TorA maturation chaperone TorD
MNALIDEQTETEATADLAVETLYRFLAAALSDPRSDRWQLARDPVCQHLAIEVADWLRQQYVERLILLGFGEVPVEELDLRPAIAALKERPIDVANDYLRIFGLVHCRECPPYETEFQPNEDTFFRSQQMADVAGFYRAFGLAPDPHERPDQICLELEFAAFLLLKKRDAENALEREQAAICQGARVSFFADHMSWWMPSFALALRTKAGDGFFEHIGRALAALLPIERHRLGIAAPRVPLHASASDAPQECAGCLGATGG